MAWKMRVRGVAVCAVLHVVAVPAAPSAVPDPSPPASERGDLEAARRLFDANLDAIRHRDRDAYLDGYWHSERLARTGPTGFELGYSDHAARSGGTTWPDVFEGRDLQLVWLGPGIVYGTYRYRVSYAGDEHRGISERLFLETDDGWKIAMTSAFDTPGAPPPPVVLLGGTLIDGTGAAPVSDSVVVVRGGRIDCAGGRAVCPVPENVEILDVSGRWITPGLVDAHVHFSQTGWADGRPDALDLRDRYPYDKVQAELRAHPERFARAFLCSGVTAVFDVGGYPWTWELEERFEDDTLAPHVAAAGPLLSTLDHWLNLPAERQFIYLDDAAAVDGDVRYLASHGADAVKVWYLRVPDRDEDEMAALVGAAGEASAQAGLPLIVHATELAEAKAALRAGADFLVHSVWDQPVDDEFIELARANEAIYCPTITVIAGYLRMNDSVLTGQPPKVDDPNGCVDPGILSRVAATAKLDPSLVDPERHARGVERVSERIETMQKNLRRVHAAGITVATGTDAGNPLTLHGPSIHAEMEAMQAAGLSPMEVLVASTRGAALAMGRLDDIGTVEAGKVADLLVVNGDPAGDVANLREVVLVIRGGVARSVDELRPITAPESGD